MNFESNQVDTNGVSGQSQIKNSIGPSLSRVGLGWLDYEMEAKKVRSKFILIAVKKFVILKSLRL